jgi:uncharacterized protein (TIGR02246 family)
MTEERLHAALTAWNTGDADRVLEFWSDDCVYHASFGPELMGRTFAGRDAVREGIRQFFDRYPEGEFADTEVMVAGARGAAEWTFRATGEDGEPFEVRGCDLFEFDGDLIRVKNAFRKVRETLVS